MGQSPCQGEAGRTNAPGHPPFVGSSAELIEPAFDRLDSCLQLLTGPLPASPPSFRSLESDLYPACPE